MCQTRSHILEKTWSCSLSGLDVNDAKEDARVQEHDGSRDVQSRISKDQQTVSAKQSHRLGERGVAQMFIVRDAAGFLQIVLVTPTR